MVTESRARPDRDVTPPPFARDFVADSLFAGEQKFTAIHGPVLAIFAAPREPSAALLKDSVALAKSDSTYLAGVMPRSPPSSAERQARG